MTDSMFHSSAPLHSIKERLLAQFKIARKYLMGAIIVCLMSTSFKNIRAQNVIMGLPEPPWTYQAGGDNCNYLPCNLIANGGFEDNSPGCLGDNLNYAINMDCWSEARPTADIVGDASMCFLFDDVVIPPLFRSTYTATGAEWGDWTESESEAVQELLAEPLNPSNDYLLTLWYYQLSDPGGFNYNSEAALDIYFGDNLFNGDLVGSPEDNGLQTIASLQTSNPGLWTAAAISFSEVNGDVIILSTNCSNIPSENLKKSYFAYDEVSLIPVPVGSPTLNIPTCTGGPIQDLEQFASIPGGVFSIAPDDGSLEVIDNGDGTFTYNLEPQGGYSYLITYTIPNGLDCPLIAAQALEVGPICIPGAVIQSNTVWSDEDFTFCGDVVVEEGISLTIDNNSEIRFADGCGIILKEGADLHVSSSLLSADLICEPFWDGIYAQRSSDYLSTADKNIINIINYSDISYASTAIDILTLSTANPNTGTYWANITIADSEFLNNWRDLQLTGQPPGNQYPIVLYTYSSFYAINDMFPADHLPHSSKCQIKYLSKPVEFLNCWFSNSHESALTEMELTGIDLVNSGIHCTSGLENSPGINSQARFRGFTRGIKSTGFGSQSTWIENVDFSCWRSVYLRNVGPSRTIDCDFYCLDATLVAALEGNLYLDESLHYITLENFDSQTAPYGEYIDGNRNTYQVLDNLFSTAIPGFGPWLAHGFIANNTGDNSNRVRRNEFESMHRALKAQGDNRTSDYNDGLKYSCNTFTDNLSDIREVNSNMGSPNTFGVPHQLSLVNSNPADPNNSFTQSICSSCGDDDLSNSTTSSLGNHNYVRVIGSQSPNDGETTDPPKVNVVPVPSGFLDECISMVQLISGGEGSDPLAQKELAESSYLALKEAYDEIIDGGSTATLVEEIQGATFGEVLALYYNLMSESPNVSEEALMEALKKYDLPNVLLTQILSSNPHSAKSGRVTGEMESRPIPFDEYQKEQINVGLNLFSSKESMEMNMAALLAVRGEALSELFLQIESDPAAEDKTAAKLDLLEVGTYYTDLVQAVDLLANAGNFDLAGQLIMSAPDYFRIFPEDLNDLQEMYDLIEIEENTKVDSSFPLSASDESALNTMLSTTSAWVSTRALDLLIEMGSIDYVEPIMNDDLELKGSTQRTYNLKRPPLRVYPNPAGEFLILEYREMEACRIELFDETGRLCYSREVSPTPSQIMLNIASLEPGVYGLWIVNAQGISLATSTFIKG